MKSGLYILFLIFTFLGQGCSGQKSIRPGADQTGEYLPLLLGKKIGIVANQTSVIGSSHLVDSLGLLLSGRNSSADVPGGEIIKVFGPEHGFRGTAEHGEHVNAGVDTRTGLPVVSLYGENRKPSHETLGDIDLVLFDMQDVGARFYTYISTLFYVMQSSAENGKEVIVLDRPNPNGFYVDGPVLEPEFSSFVGMHEIPVVYGMTIGEYARMVNGEGWLGEGLTCNLTVIPCKNYTHRSLYELPVPPSPNLPEMNSIYLYPSTCFFEGTVLSEGRGTDAPFEIFGHPDLEGMDYSFTPRSIPGKSIDPKFRDKECFGMDLRYLRKSSSRKSAINLSWIISAYLQFPDKENFFLPYFENLAGTAKLRQQIKEGLSEEEIRASWQDDLDDFRKVREKYLIYPE